MKNGKRISLDKNWRIITTIYNYKDMADGNFTTNQRLLGKCVHEMEILLLAKIRRMATKHVAKMTELFSPLAPRSASRPGFIL
jgi:hypothetical protein